MRYYHLPHAGGPDALTLDSRDEPVPGPGRVLVRMRAWSLNFRDLLISQGAYGRSVVPDVIPVSDGSGEVVEVGPDVTRWKVGDRVVSVFLPRWIAGPATAGVLAGALGGPVDGVLAEYVGFDEAALVGVPAHLDFAEAATLPCAAVTAWHSIFEGRGLRPGEQILTLGSGGVSVFAVQLAVAAGAEVVATSGNDAKLARLGELGAAMLVNHRQDPQWGRTAYRLAGAGVDNVIEVGGAGTLAQSLAAVGTGGRISLIGVLSGAATLDPTALLGNAVSLHGMTVGSRAMFESMNRALELRDIHPVIDRPFAFAEAPAAYRHLGSQQHFGKVVIVDP